MEVFKISNLIFKMIIFFMEAIYAVGICTFQSPLSSTEKEVCKSPVHCPGAVHPKDFNSYVN
jgi:hypothetical protein